MIAAPTRTRPTAARGKKRKQPRHQRLPLARLRSNLGGHPALMALTYGSKARSRCWVECHSDARLKTKNVAVVQGKGRGGIDGRGVCSIDIDGNEEHGITAESVAEQLFNLNPHLRWSFRTAGKRGFNVWIRISGNVPNGFNLYTADGVKVGEFRATGNYTVVAGKHPDGPRYRTIVDLPAHEVTDISALTWVDGNPFSEKSTQDYTETYIEEKAALHGDVSLLLPIILSHLPTAPHQTDQLHFEMAGAIRGSGFSLTPSEVRQVGLTWWDKADKRFLRSSLDRDNYADQWVSRYNRRKYATGQASVAFAQALERANQLDPPQMVAESFPHNPRIQFIGTLCRELARGSANKRFFLSARTIRDLLEVGAQTIGCTILKQLESIGLIACVDRPPRGTRKANTYIYLLDDFDVEVTS